MSTIVKRTVDLIVENATLIVPSARPPSQVPEQADRPVSIACANGLIVDVATPADIASRFSAPVTHDAAGCLLSPGFVNTHTHTFQSLLKGLAKDLRLIDWLNAAIRPSFAKLTEEALYAATLLSCMDAVSSGTTTILDYAYASISPRSMHAVCRAMNELGIRGVLGRGYTEHFHAPVGSFMNLSETMDTVFGNVLELVREYEGTPLTVFLAPTAIHNISAPGLKATADFSHKHNIPVTMHINETLIDNEYCRKQHDCTCTELLETSGLLEQPFLAVHCVEMSGADIDRFARHKVSISNNPVSNLIMGSGIAPVRRMLDAGLNVSFGTDGAGSNDTQNMLDTIRIGTLVQKGFYKDPMALSARQALEIATTNGARALGLGSVTGSIEAGKAADFVLFNFDGSYAQPIHDHCSALVYQTERDNVAAVFVAGEKIFANGTFMKVDKDAILDDIGRISQAMRSHAAV